MKTLFFHGVALVLIMGLWSTNSRADVLYQENFDGIVLEDSVDEGVPSPVGDPGGIPGVDVWSSTPPPGWVRNDAGVPGALGGFPDNDGVREWAGWAFVDPTWWVNTAGDQRRSEFVNGSGVIAVADSDEWDDAPHPGGPPFGPWYDAFITTPSIPLLGNNFFTLDFDSSWRDEFDDNFHQTASLTVFFDVGPSLEILRWESDSTSILFKDDAPNEHVTIEFTPPAGASSMSLRFGLFDAGNDWWWAVDNIVIGGIAAPSGPFFAPGDTVFGGQLDGGNFNVGVPGFTGGVNNWPFAEPPEAAIDGRGQKHLNFAEFSTGLVVTPSAGPTVATSIKFWTANDAIPRDPTGYELFGTNNPLGAGPFPIADFTLISAGDLALPDSRNGGGDTPLDDANSQTIMFANSASFTSYMIGFPAVKDEASANSMQIAEVQLFGLFGLPGDMNGDGKTNAFDIEGFVLALVDPDGFAAQTGRSPLVGDINGDGVLNAFDIGSFVALLTGGAPVAAEQIAPLLAMLPNTESQSVASGFRILVCQTSPSGVEIEWTSEIGRHYVVEHSPTARPESWKAVNVPVEAMDKTTMFLDSHKKRLSGANAFYRIRVLE